MTVGGVARHINRLVSRTGEGVARNTPRWGGGMGTPCPWKVARDPTWRVVAIPQDGVREGDPVGGWSHALKAALGRALPREVSCLALACACPTTLRDGGQGAWRPVERGTRCPWRRARGGVQPKKTRHTLSTRPGRLVRRLARPQMSVPVVHVEVHDWPICNPIRIALVPR